MYSGLESLTIIPSDDVSLLYIQFYILFYIYAIGISFSYFLRFIHPCLLFITLKKQSDKKCRYAYLLLLTLCSVSHSNFLPPPPKLIYTWQFPCDNLFTAPSTVLKINIIFISWTTVTNDLIHLLKQWLMITDMFSIKTIANNPIHLIKIVKWIQTFEDSPFPFPPSHFGDTSALLLDWLLVNVIK